MSDDKSYEELMNEIMPVHLWMTEIINAFVFDVKDVPNWFEMEQFCQEILGFTRTQQEYAIQKLFYDAVATYIVAMNLEEQIDGATNTLSTSGLGTFNFKTAHPNGES